MSIVKYENDAAYQAAGYPTNESRVAKIDDTGDIKIDGVNIIVSHPTIGDAVYKKDGKRYFYKGGNALNHSLLTAAGFEGLGQIIGWRDGKAIYLDREISSAKYLDVSQYAWTDVVLDGTEQSKTIGICCGVPDWGTTQSITFVYTATTLAEAAAACTAAIETKLAEISASSTEIGYWWAYADEDNNRVIVQRDTCTDYRFYVCSGLTHITWEDMPESNAYLKSNGRVTNYRGLMNIARGKAYWPTNGRNAAGAADVWHGAIEVNDNPLQQSVFETTSMYGDGEHQYSTYEDYLRGEFGIMSRQKYGAFNLPSAEVLSKKYADKTVPTKSGGTKYKYPAFHFASAIDRGVPGLNAGDLFLTGLEDGLIFMEDEKMAIINITRSKMGHSLISNGSSRWFAQRYNAYYAWIFSGNSGFLNPISVSYSYQVQDAALLDI